MKDFKVVMKQVCQQVVQIQAKDKEEAVKKIMLGQGKVIFSNFQPSLSPDSWEVQEIK